MRICIVTPTDAQSRRGNWVTAARWRRILRKLGHRVIVRQRYDDEPCDLLIALHARRSYPSMARFRHRHPDAPLILALTGTDLYGDLRVGTRARRALQWASRLVVLHPLAVGVLPRGMREKARLIYQSVDRPRGKPINVLRSFDVCVLGHLRAVKDPFRAAMAVRNLPAASASFISATLSMGVWPSALEVNTIATPATAGWEDEHVRRPFADWPAAG